MADSRDDTSGVMWFVAGAICGAAVALLYAPNSGKQTRKLIGKRSDETRDSLQEGSKDLVDKGKELYDRGRQIAEDAADLFDKGRKLVRG